MLLNVKRFPKTMSEFLDQPALLLYQDYGASSWQVCLRLTLQQMSKPRVSTAYSCRDFFCFVDKIVLLCGTLCT